MRVTLSSGREVIVGSLRWSAFKRIKARVVQAISQDIGELLSSGLLFSEGDEGRKFSVAGMVAILDKAIEAADDCNEMFVEGCIGSKLYEEIREELTVEDVGRLSDAAIKLNPIADIVQFEKNSPVGALIAESGLFSSSVPDLNNLANAVETLNAGGSGTKPSLYDPDGATES